MFVHKDNRVGSGGVPIENVTRLDCEEFRLTPNDDGSSPNISIGFTFPFFAKRFNNVYVSILLVRKHILLKKIIFILMNLW